MRKTTVSVGVFSPRSSIADLSFENCFIDPDAYHERTDELVEAYVEYAQSVALAVERPGTTIPAAEWVDERADDVRTVVESTQAYFFTEFTQEGFEQKYPSVEAEVRMLTIMRTLKMRGDSVQEQGASLTASAYRYVELSGERVAIVWSEQGDVKWAKTSDVFTAESSVVASIQMHSRRTHFAAYQFPIPSNASMLRSGSPIAI
jgi:hypothetical protein